MTGNREVLALNINFLLKVDLFSLTDHVKMSNSTQKTCFFFFSLLSDMVEWAVSSKIWLDRVRTQLRGHEIACWRNCVST